MPSVRSARAKARALGLPLLSNTITFVSGEGTCTGGRDLDQVGAAWPFPKTGGGQERDSTVWLAGKARGGAGEDQQEAPARLDPR